MRFEMFTEPVELFALHINFFNLNEFSFQFVCSTQIKMYQESGFLGSFFWYCILQDRCSFQGLRPLDPHQGSALDPLGPYSAPPPDKQLLQAMKYSHCISCFQQDTTFIHALTTNLTHHSKFLKKKACNKLLVFQALYP